MAHLVLSVNELQQELMAIEELGGQFLAPEAPQRLDLLRRQLGALVQSSGGVWQTASGQPIATEPNNLYAGGGGTEVWGNLEFTWAMEPVTGRHKKNRRDLVRLTGQASSRISVWRNPAQPEPVAMWRMEIGTETSPGGYFHTQVQGQSDNPPFPDWLEVPRLPIPFATPAVALEFLLSELYQREWERVTSQIKGGLRQFWGGVQKRRLISVMTWQGRMLDQQSRLPWTALKVAKPDERLVKELAGS